MSNVMDLKLYEKQYLALTTEATEVLYGGAAGSGKLAKISTPVLTANRGWQTMGSLVVGDYVFDKDGNQTRVVAKSDIEYERTFEVEFDGWATIIAGENHDWLTHTEKERDTNFKRSPEYREKRRKQRAEKRAEGVSEKEKKTSRVRDDIAERNSLREYELLPKIEQQLRNTLEIFETQKTNRGRTNHTIEIAKGIQYPERELPIPPYVLGAWLGDGCQNSGQYTSIDIPVIEKITKLGFEVSSGTQEKNWYIKGLVGKLREAGVQGNKHIPEIYKTASFEQRLELVRGILDADGTVDKNGAIEISLSHEPLALDFHEVLVSLGVKCNIREREAKLYGVNKKNRFRMNFFTDIPMFSLPRQVERWKNSMSKETSSTQRRNVWYITKVTEVEPVPMQCIQVDCPSHTYLIGRELIPTHNSFLLRNAAFLYCMFIPGYTAVIFRRHYNDLMNSHVFSVGGLRDMCEPWIKIGKVNFNMSDKRIEFYHPDQKVSYLFLRHISNDNDMYNYQGSEFQLCIFDETVQFPENVYRFIRTRVRLGGLQVNYPAVQKYLPWINEKNIVKILCATNPGGLYGRWVKRAFIDPAQPMTVWQTPPEEGGMKRIFIPAFLSDNLIMMDSDPEYGDRLRGAGGAWAKQLLEGDWNILDGGAFSDVWQDNIHMIEPFEIPTNAHIIRCMDWGTFHPTAIVYLLIVGKDPFYSYSGEERRFEEGSVIVIKEIYNWNGKDNEGNRMSAFEVGQQMARFEASVPWYGAIRRGPADVMIFQNRGGVHETIDSLIADGYNEEMRHFASVSSEFRYVHDIKSLFVRADQSRNTRATGVQVFRTYLRGSLEGKRGVYFFNTCEQCYRTIPSLPRSETDPEDINTKAEDHLFDTIRYGIMSQRGQFTPLKIIGF